RATISLQDELDDLGVLEPSRGPERRGDDSDTRIAVCPSQRAAMVYALRELERDAMRASVVARAVAIEGVEHVMWLARDAHDAPREGIIMSPRHGELRFCPGGPVRDERGANWSVEGALAAPAVAGPLAVACLLALAGAQPAAAEPVALAAAPGESTPGLLRPPPPGPPLPAAPPRAGSTTHAQAPASSGQSTSAGAPIP